MRWLLLFLAACSSESAVTPQPQPQPQPQDAGTTMLDDAATEVRVDAGADAVVEDARPAEPTWSILRPELVDVSVRPNGLTLRATAYSLWFNASRGPLVYRRVSGDFGIRARVRTLTASGSPPPQTIHLGGLMARSPAGGGESYVFIVVGHDVNDLSVETKTTTSDVSTYEGPSWPSSEAELRLCRAGATFRLYKRALGASDWTLARTYDRPDLPAALDVGAVMYAAAQQPDLIVTYDDIQLDPGC